MLLASRWAYNKHPEELDDKQLHLVETEWLPLFILERERNAGIDAGEAEDPNILNQIVR